MSLGNPHTSTYQMELSVLMFYSQFMCKFCAVNDQSAGVLSILCTEVVSPLSTIDSKQVVCFDLDCFEVYFKF
mgnify:CR=1 FL=1